MPSTTHVITKGMARLFRDHVHKLHDLPKVILSNKNTMFTNRFWNALHGLLGTSLAMSTVCHPQTDGQTNHMNCVIHDMLQHYVNPMQIYSDEFLVMLEFAYYSSWQEFVWNTPIVLNTCQIVSDTKYHI